MMGCLWLQVLWLVFVSESVIQKINADNPPHIIFILADDMGWNDVSFHGSDQIPTPNIDSLAYNGVILNRHYVQPLCTPTRASLMTGEYPIHTGLHWAMYSSEKNGIPLSEKLLPEYLKDVGYTTHLVGKWHLGFYKEEFTPLRRGFDSHFGYWTGAVSYYDHICEDVLSSPDGAVVLSCNVSEAYQSFGGQTDCSKIRTEPNKTIFSGHDMRRNYSSAWDVVGQYATDLFTTEAIHLIDHHPPDKPMFLLLSHLAVHAGNQGKWLEAPQEEINRFSYITNPNRRTYAAMVSKLDQSIGNVVEALGRKDMLRNSIIIFASDNGAPNIGLYNNWGSNYPFRGQKTTLWEGAIRVPAVVWSPLINKSSRVSNGLMHITDWLPTLLAAAGHDTMKLNIDGLDQWQTITNAYPSPRDNLVVDVIGLRQMNGLILGSFKYIKGAVTFPFSPTMSQYLNFDTIFSKKAPKYDIEKILTSQVWMALQNVTKQLIPKSSILRLRQEATVTCEKSEERIVDCDEKACLFNIITDPCEQKDIAAMFPVLTVYMDMVLNYYRSGAFPENPLFVDPQSDPDLYNGTWNMWVT